MRHVFSRPISLLLVASCLLPLVGCGDDSQTGGAGGGGGGDEGGGGASSTTARYVSGTRLKVSVSRAGDAEQFAYITDTTLGVTCEPFDDGSETRCFPSSASAIQYQDAACTEPVLVHFTPTCGESTVPAYTTEYSYEPNGCGASAAQALAVGEEVASPPSELFLKDPTGCLSVGPPGTEVTLYELSPVDPSELVTLEQVFEPRGDELEAVYYESADGFRVIQSAARDTARERECRATLIEGQSVCAPPAAYGYAPSFADPACTDENAAGAFNYQTSCGKPDFAYVDLAPPGSCSSDLALFAAGEDVAEAYVDLGGGCSPLGSEGYDTALLGAAVPSSELPSVEQVDEGTGAVRARGFHAAGAPLDLNTQWVTEQGIPCYPYPFPDGVVRCGPPTLGYVPAVGGRFADDACSQPVVLLPNNCLSDSLEHAVVAGDGPCGGLEPHALGPAHDGPVYIEGGAGGCVMEAAQPDFVARIVGEASPYSDFVEISVEQLD